MGKKSRPVIPSFDTVDANSFLPLHYTNTQAQLPPPPPEDPGEHATHLLDPHNILSDKKSEDVHPTAIGVQSGGNKQDGKPEDDAVLKSVPPQVDVDEPKTSPARKKKNKRRKRVRGRLLKEVTDKHALAALMAHIMVHIPTWKLPSISTIWKNIIYSGTMISVAGIAMYHLSAGARVLLHRLPQNPTILDKMRRFVGLIQICLPSFLVGLGYHISALGLAIGTLVERFTIVPVFGCGLIALTAYYWVVIGNAFQAGDGEDTEDQDDSSSNESSSDDREPRSNTSKEMESITKKRKTRPRHNGSKPIAGD